MLGYSEFTPPVVIRIEVWRELTNAQDISLDHSLNKKLIADCPHCASVLHQILWSIPPYQLYVMPEGAVLIKLVTVALKKISNQISLGQALLPMWLALKWFTAWANTQQIETLFWSCINRLLWDYQWSKWKTRTTQWPAQVTGRHNYSNKYILLHWSYVNTLRLILLQL